MVAADEENRVNRRRREVRELEEKEKRVKEEGLLRETAETARQVALPDHDTSDSEDDDDDDALYMYHKLNGPASIMDTSGFLPDNRRKLS